MSQASLDQVTLAVWLSSVEFYLEGSRVTFSFCPSQGSLYISQVHSPADRWSGAQKYAEWRGASLGRSASAWKWRNMVLESVLPQPVLRPWAGPFCSPDLGSHLSKMNS